MSWQDMSEPRAAWLADFGGVGHNAAIRLGSAACWIVRMFTAAVPILCLVPRALAFEGRHAAARMACPL